MTRSPPEYPLVGAAPTFDTKLLDSGARLGDVWNGPFYSLPLPTDTRESRKRFRMEATRSPEGSVELQATFMNCESTEDLLLTDLDAPDSLAHPPKRRLMSAALSDSAPPVLARFLPSLANSSSCSMPTSAHAVVTPGDRVHQPPCTPKVLESADATPVSDMDEQSVQHLVLPLPLASPVQTSTDKPSVYDELERLMLQMPATQGELVELVLNLGDFVLEKNRNHLVFQMLKLVPRLSLLSLCGIIEKCLRRDLLSSLPVEILLNILSYLDAPSVLAVSQVCRLWHKLVNNTALWCTMLRKSKLLTDLAQLHRELSNPARLMAEWANPSPLLADINPAQILYKKRRTILNRWMDPNYEPSRISVAGHGSSIVTCLQHDEEKVVTGLEGKLINIYSTKTGKLMQLLKGHDGGVWALKYFSNTLVTGSTDRDVRVWNIRTGQCTHVFRGHTSTVRCLDILHPVQIGVNDNGEPIMYPEYPLLVTGSRDHNLHVWKLPLDSEGEGSDVNRETKVYDAKDPSNPYLVALLLGHTQSVRSVTGYGNIIISGSYDTTIRVWDLLDGGRCKHVLEGHTDKIYSTALSFKNKRCYSGSLDLSINVWDFEKGKLLYTLQGHSSLVGLLALSDDYLVSAAADSTLRVWDPKTGENLSKLKGHNGAITCFQHDSLRIVSGSERMFKLWDIRSGKFVRDLLSDITGGIWQVSFDADRCIAAVQKMKNDTEETYIEILDFSAPLNQVSPDISGGNMSSMMEVT